MGHSINQKLNGPEASDQELVKSYFLDKCNCYAYAVQDYFAGFLDYLPRPGQTRGVSYSDLKGNNIEGMRRAIHEDGLNFAGLKYPKKIPENHYVICCFLEPTEYHFIRQDADGSWSSKNGRGEPTKTDEFGEPLLDPENFYHHDKNYPFVGYFFVPKGGIKVGLKVFEKTKLSQLDKKIKVPEEKREKALLSDLVRFSKAEEETLQKLRKCSGISKKLEQGAIWNDYQRNFERLSRLCQNIKYDRRDILKAGYTRPKQARLGKSR